MSGVQTQILPSNAVSIAWNFTCTRRQ